MNSSQIGLSGNKESDIDAVGRYIERHIEENWASPYFRPSTIS